MPINVFPIDKHGFIVWEFYRLADEDEINPPQEYDYEEKEIYGDNGEVVSVETIKTPLPPPKPKPLPDGVIEEIITPVPMDNDGEPWHVSRWDGNKWVEGKDHPNAPTPEASPDYIPPPTDGIYWILDGEKTLEEMKAYLSELVVSADDVKENLQHLCDSRIVPALVGMVQDLIARVEALEGVR